MTFYGDEIKTPTVEQVEVYIAEKGLFVTPKQVFNYWSRKDWKTKKGLPVKTLETAINVVNSIVIQREQRKIKNNNNKTKKKKKWKH